MNPLWVEVPPYIRKVNPLPVTSIKIYNPIQMKKRILDRVSSFVISPSDA